MVITMQTVSVLATMSVDELKALLAASRGVKQAPAFVLPGMARAFEAYRKAATVRAESNLSEVL